MKAVERRVREILGEFDAQGLANTVWAFAKLEMKEEALMKAVARRALEILEEFNAQNLATMVWAFAKLRVKHAELLRAVASFGATLRSTTTDPLVEFLSRRDVDSLLEISTQEDEAALFLLLGGLEELLEESIRSEPPV